MIFVFILLKVTVKHFRVTVLKDRETRKSKGVAFILFLKKEDALKCATETNGKQVMFVCQLPFVLFARVVWRHLCNDTAII